MAKTKPTVTKDQPQPSSESIVSTTVSEPSKKKEILFSIPLNIHIEDLSMVIGDLSHIIHGTDGQRYFDNGDEDSWEIIDLGCIKFELNYPLSTIVQLSIESPGCVADVLVPIADTYANIIYADPEKYGIDHHGIEDLVFEGLVIYDDHTGEIIIGS